ncbi:hypothetical protein SAMN02745248_01127 [Hathewaya proteolytica DSM 3090]|uniref:Peptidase M16C associated domain-containing protein n=1 Tax=Hathewaya proteolytica DSM 3090 TaxID=1121331 RepID=A0A1M6MR96_9CLOT|nr:insulinase family protein [Hathewaya proteolytica]SHJ85926.1 hypothetical protein SAMN02745248_01127 [Hathewaya proteolytica DSM 3090]
MNFKINEVYHGFKLIEEKDIKEINGIGRIFQHEKSGARLFALNNDDDNKVFTIAFRTPVEDSTGVPHILEHSVLCGSDKYPTKEPFVDLIKGSLNTFLNAFTFPDKTMYPVASKNDKDFINLMSVYLDAVFYPNLRDTKEIMMQEGWHYEIEDKNEPLTYKGVVYNEMRGAFSSPEGVLFRKIQETLFKDTTYFYESGGDPEFIPDLTQEKFVEFHKKYYHPCNSYITLYGNGDLDKQLAMIDDEYLQNFDKINVDSHIDIQQPYSARVDVVKPYAISEEDDDTDKAMISLNYVTGSQKDVTDHLGMDILESILLETPASPLKNALIKAGIGKDVYGSYDGGILQPTFSIIVKDTDENRKEEFCKIVNETLAKLVKDGIDKKLVEGCVNSTEFKLRECDGSYYPKGLIYAMNCLESWLYDESPFNYIEYGKLLKDIKEGAENGYFEKLIEKYLLDNTHSSVLTLVPDKTLAAKKDKELKEKLAKIKANMSEEQLEEIIENTVALKKRQSTPDTPEQLAKIPLLSRDDINKKAEEIKVVEREVCGEKVLYLDEFTNQIVYFIASFDSSAVKKELIPYLSVLSYMLGKLSTAKHNYNELSNEININTGDISFSADSYASIDDTDTFCTKFTMRGRALTEKTKEMLSLMAEIISSTKFDEFDKIHEFIRQLKSRMEMSMIDSAHRMAIHRVMSYFSDGAAYAEQVSGIDFYKFISILDKDFENKKEEIKTNLETVAKTVFNKNNLIISVAGEEAEFKAVEENLSLITDVLESREIEVQKYEFEKGKKNEGIETPADVQYVCKQYNITNLGYKYTGKLLVAKVILGLDYLWNKVRVQGGAYGCPVVITRSGNIGFASYRDPNLKDTLNIYDEMWKYLKDFKVDEREMTKYIIGAVRDLDMPMSPSVKLTAGLVNHIKGISQDMIQQERDEVLSTTEEDIRSFSEMFKKLMEENYMCVIGNETKIRENKELFNNIIKLFQ